MDPPGATVFPIAPAAGPPAGAIAAPANAHKVLFGRAAVLLMDRVDVALALLVVFGVVVFLSAPPDPEYSVSVRQASAPGDADVRSFSTLGAEAQDRFVRAVDGESVRFGDPPTLENGFVRYDGTTYRVSVSAHEGPVLAMVMPALGIALAGLGVVGLVGRRGWRAVRSGEAG